MDPIEINITNPTPIEISLGAGLQGPAGVDGTGLTPIASNTILGNSTGSTAIPQALGPSAARTAIGAASLAENSFSGSQTYNGTPNPSFPQRVGTAQIVEGALVQSGNGDTTGAGQPRTIHRFNSSQTDSDAVGWGMIYTNSGLFVSGSGTTYRDHVYVVGMNVAGSQQRVDINKPYMAFQYESKFTNSNDASFGSELHIEHIAPGTGKPTLRAWSWFLPFDLTQRGVGSVVYNIDVHSFNDQLGTTRMQWNLHNNQLLMLANTELWDGNNRAFAKQQNAALSAYLDLPYFDSTNRIRLTAGVSQAGSVTSLHSGVANVFQVTAWNANNDKAFQVVGANDAVAGSKVYTGLETQASINGVWQNTHTNTYSGGQSVQYISSAGSAGQSYTRYYNTALGGFDVGFDGATETFRIDRHFAFGNVSLNYFRITRASAVPANSIATFPGSVAIVGTLTVGSSGTAIVRVLSATATLDFGSIAAQSFADLTITVTGAALGDTVSIGVPNGSITNDLSFFGWVSATNTVSIRCTNVALATARDPASGTYRATVTKF